MSYQVLIVDDDAEFRKLVRPALEERNCHVEEATTGSEGLAAAQERQFDIIIVDGILPDTDGIDLIGQLRHVLHSIPIVYVSALWLDVQTYRKLTQELGVFLIIIKPVMVSVFGEQIISLLRQQEHEKVAYSSALKTKSKSVNTLAALTALRVRYASELPMRLQELLHALQEAKENPDDLALFTEARNRVHKIRGTAGSHGFTKVGASMAMIEELMLSQDFKHQTQQWVQIEGICLEAIDSLKNLPTSEPSNTKEQELGVLSTVALARVLFVDDDPNFLSFVELLGRQRLVEIVGCSSSSEALDRAQEVSLDGAIIDVQLGAGDVSFELARRLRELPNNENLPLAFISAQAHVYDRVAAAHSGASLYLSKPLDPDAFESAVQHLTSLKRAEQPRVLVVDDDENFASTVTALLHLEGMRVYTLADPVKVLETLQEINPDLLVLDLLMPGISGFDVCRMLRTVSRWQDLPIILATAQTGIHVRVGTFQCGADDYLPKPVADEELISAVKLRIERSRLLRERATKDPITGLWLRRPFIEQLSAALATAKKLEHNLVLGLIDLDHFKQINDTHGHLAGDTVLSAFGKLLLRRFPVEQLRGRWGGDEFIIAFPAMTTDEANGALLTFLTEFKNICFTGEDGTLFTASFSAGLARFPEDGDNGYSLIKIADQRLYTAKRQGRNRIITST